MALDLVELLPDLVRGHERVVEVPLLELVVLGQEGFVVGEGFDYSGGKRKVAWLGGCVLRFTAYFCC